MDRAFEVREVLSTRGLTLNGVSRKSAELFGRSSEFYIPHTLYTYLMRAGKSPSICQLLALSQITNYRLSDWLLMFGFELDAVFRLRLTLLRRNTVILDSVVYDPCAWIPWFTERAPRVPLAQIAPLGQVLAPAPDKRATKVLAANQRKFLYAVVGAGDLYALPHFAAGSVIRADPLRAGELPTAGDVARPERFFLLEHVAGWSCSRLVALGNNRVLLHCPQGPCIERECKIGRDLRILGAIDAEIRPLTRRAGGGLPSKTAWPPRVWPGDSLHEERSLTDLLRRSRLEAGLSFREASALSRRIAETVGDELYFAAASTLSDYETLSIPPHPVQKIVTLCVLYGIGLEKLLRAGGLPIEHAGREAIPEELLPRATPDRARTQAMNDSKDTQEQGGFLGMLLDQWQEIPLFLRFSLGGLSGIKKLSLSDLFWVGGEHRPRHPLLANASIVAVNRRKRRLAPHRTLDSCQGSLHMVLVRDGSYLCGRCSVDKGNLIVDGYPRAGVSAREFRNSVDAEVVGQVTAIVRRLG